MDVGTNPQPMISPETILRAKSLIEGIEKLQAELAGLFSGAAAPVSTAFAAAVPPAKRRGRPPGSGVGKKRGAMSAEGRARIAAAAKARWARYHAEQKKGK